jgi:1,4-alpha-glucan branching enzyme
MRLDLLERRKDAFALWLPTIPEGAPPPRLVIGVATFEDGHPPSLEDRQSLELNPTAPGLWERPAGRCGLADGRVYHYWFEVTNTSPYKEAPLRVLCTDPLATAVDWRLCAPPLPPPFGGDDEDPAAVVLFRDGRLVPCDPDGGTIDWGGDRPLRERAPNHRLVIYELPTSWVVSGEESGRAVGVGTFRDVAALVSEARGPAGTPEVPATALGRAHLQELGVNALELLPPADSFSDRARIYNLWGYATSNYFAADFELGRPGGHGAPTASRDLAALVALCHQHGIRFFYDAVMAFSRNDPYQNAAFLDFHVLFGSGDPEQSDRDGFGGDLFKYNLFHDGLYDPISGETRTISPARQWMKLHLAHWMLHYRIDGIRLDSVNNVRNYDFVQEVTTLARSLWHERWEQEETSAHGASERFLVAGEELSVPMALLDENRLDALWNETFKRGLRQALLGRPADFDQSFEWTVRKLVDGRLLGFADGARVVNYVTSHDVGGFGNERLYDYLHHAGVALKEERIKLAFVCLLTAVGIPMILAGEEFADEHDLELSGADGETAKQVDPVNFERRDEPWRRRVFDCVSRLVKLRTRSHALAFNDTEFLHVDMHDGKRVLAWLRGRRGDVGVVVVVANFSDWSTAEPDDPRSEYVVNGWPDAVPERRWREVTTDRDVQPGRAGREPLRPWDAKVYELV